MENIVVIFTFLFLMSSVAIPIGLIKPSIVLRFLSKENQTRKKVLIIYGSSFLLFLILSISFAPDSPKYSVEEVSIKDINPTQGVKVEQNKPNARIVDEKSIPAEKVDSLAKTFCEERSEPGVRYVNFDDFVKMVENAPEEVYLHPAGGTSPTQESCKNVADVCLKLWTEEDCTNIAQRKIKIGMEKSQLILSWGLPNRKNDTHNAGGIYSQWVYGNFGPYVYLEGVDENSLKVTSWQD